jgi:hypothetical protein
MGVDLKLLIVDGGPFPPDKPTFAFAHTMIEFGRWYDVFARLDKKAFPMPDGLDFTSYVSQRDDGEQGYGRVTGTPYGNPLTFITAADFLDCCSGANSGRGKAAMAYVRELPPETWIGLYYH